MGMKRRSARVAITLSEFCDSDTTSALILETLAETVSTYERTGSADDLPASVQLALATGDPKVVYNDPTVAAEHFVGLAAAELNCVALFRLRVEGIGRADGLEFFLLQACIHGASDVIDYLIKAGVDVNTHDKVNFGHTPLHWAVYQGELEAVVALLRSVSLEVDAEDSKGFTALDLALANRYGDIAKALIDAGAVIRDDAIVAAAESMNYIPLELVIAHASNLNIVSRKKGIGPLHAAVACDWAEAASRLLAAGVDPSTKSTRKYKKRGNTFAAKQTAAEFAKQVGSAELMAVFD